MRRALDKGLLKERFTEHDIRAKTLTDADERGQDAQRLAGHKSRAMTDRYIKTRRIEKVKPLARNI
jgi:integrase